MDAASTTPRLQPGCDGGVLMQRVVSLPEHADHLDMCEHLATCPGCDECDYLLEFFMACDVCGMWGHVDSDGWVREDEAAAASRVLCYSCGLQANAALSQAAIKKGHEHA